MIKKTITLLGLLPLIIHELSHLLCIVMLSAKGDGVDISGDLRGLEIEVHYKTNSNLVKNIISMAPIGGLIIWVLLILLTSGWVLFSLIIYTLFYLKTFLPSNVDIDTFNRDCVVNNEIPYF